MRELLVVIRVMEIPLLSLSWVRSRLSELSFRVVAHVLPCSWIIYFKYCSTFILLSQWHRGVP